NPDSRAAIENEAYQDLFGGETMIVLFTMDEGRTVEDLFTPANLAAFAQVEEQLRASDHIASVVSPATTLTFTENLVTSGVATEVLLAAIEREPDPDGVAARQADLGITAARLAAAGEQSVENPAWVRFLLFDNTGFSVTDDGELVEADPSDLQIR